MKAENQIAFCGLKCQECPIYQATVTNDDALRVKLANDYSSDACKFEKDDINCYGCQSEKGISPKMCGGCEIRNCGIEKNLPHCAACNNYPCDHIERYVPQGCDNRILLDKLLLN